MKKITPQYMRPVYYEPIEAQLLKIFYDILFRPLKEIGDEANAQMALSAHGIMNAADNALQIALRTGRIQYEAGVFSGSFNAATIRVMRAVGAKYDIKQKVYRLEPALTPGWIKAEASNYQATARGAHDSMQRQLDEIQKNLDGLLDKKDIRAQKTMSMIERDFTTSAKAISVKPELTEDSSKRLAVDYNQNMKLYVKDFLHKEIGTMRQTVQANAEAGYRFDTLIDRIKNRYGVSQNKAKFLARQETALFMSKYRKERFSEAGVTRYKWSTSHDERVRPSPGTHGVARQNNHRVLDGRVFAYSDPPVVDTATGRRANPGEDFNCRCVDVPILEAVA